MKKHVFIINPASGTGKYQKILKLIEDNFVDSKLDYEIRKTEYEKHAIEIAQEYRGDVVLYSVGGDGTAHEILNGIHPEVEMAIIPVGTGNDFWRMIDYKDSLKEILYNTIEGKTIEVDVGLANGRRFLNCANVGLDAEVNRRVNNVRLDWVPRGLVYLYAALRELRFYKPIDVEIDLDGVKSNHKLLLSSFMNGKWYGGGFKSAPHANITDRKLDVCLVEEMPMSKILKVIPKYFKGEHLALEEVTYQQVSAIRIKSDEKIIIGNDGELFEFDDIEIKVDPNTLKLRIPFDAKLKH